MTGFKRNGFFSGVGTIPLAGAVRRHVDPPRLSQQPIQSPRVAEARRALDKATEHYKSVEDNLSMLDATMGPEAALQALQEGSDSVDRARKDLEDAIGGTISQ